MKLPVIRFLLKITISEKGDVCIAAGMLMD